ncbi:uncharacterized protein [Rutidosis leptorrhynchoides]|uniref:uncharacterized protein n=1 Tax=Rutidosis leptorrhynchoides TaxID=125765 RepID=UPI003A9A502D
MEEVKRDGPQLEDITDLVHRIQSLLPVEEAARTCVLSKSWLHAWSTIPTLRFYKPKRLVSKEEETNRMNSIDRTVQRYSQHNIPIETFDLELRMENQELTSLANKWIQIVATNTCLKELSLKISNDIDSKIKLTLTDELFSGENLHSIAIIVDNYSRNGGVLVTRNPVIN